MHKVKKLFQKTLPPVTLYLRDLEELQRLLTKNGRRINLTHNDYHFDSIDELIKETKVVNIYDVDMFSKDQDGYEIWVKLHKDGASVTSLQTNDRPQQLAAETYNLIEEFKTPVAYYLKWLSLSLVLIYLLVASSSDNIIGLPIGLYPYLKGHTFLQFLYFILCGIMLSYPFIPSLAFQRCKIILKHRGEIPTWWQENKGKWAAKAVEWLL
jgi:hypothetical protein